MQEIAIFLCPTIVFVATTTGSDQGKLLYRLAFLLTAVSS